MPELTQALAQAACASREGSFRDFNLSAAEWEELHIAGWLHDCGKITTPEYVVDKATKLETIYDRIHEVRMRFEVLKLDYQGFFCLRDLDKSFWMRLSLQRQRSAEEKLDDFHTTPFVHY